MKIWLWSLSLLVLLTACSTEKSAAEPQISTEPDNSVEEVAEKASSSSAETVEIPISVQENDQTTSNDTQSNLSETAFTGNVDTLIVDGLVEDAVSFCYYIPVFSDCNGAEKINEYYSELSDTLSDYSYSTVYTQCSERHTVADVTSNFSCSSVGEDQILKVVYTVEVKYADNDQPDSFSRTDLFDLETGELQSSDQ